MRTQGLPVRRSRWLALVLGVGGLLPLLPASAHAADRVYFANFAAPKISYGELSGGPAVDLDTGGATVNEAIGTTLDPATGRIYWANHTGNTISYAGLGGGGGGDLQTGAATVSGPAGVSIDPRTRRIYWGNTGSNTISWASLDGSGGGNLNTTGATVSYPAGVVVDPAAGRIYWTNFSADKISWANLDGSGGGDLKITGTATLKTPLGLAIDRSAGRIYWANDVAGKISYANLDGTASADLYTGGATVEGPYGVAVDAAAGRVYWADTSADRISYADLDGSGGGDLPISIPEGNAPNFAALLEAPRGTGTLGASRQRRSFVLRSFPPKVRVGSLLSCADASWMADASEAFLFRAPASVSYRWLSNGASVPESEGQTFGTSSAGVYRCAATAANLAGGTTRTSPPVTALGFFISGARITVAVSSPGKLILSGRWIVRRVSTRTGRVVLRVAPRGRKRKAFRRGGLFRLGVRLRYLPAEGPPLAEKATVILKRRRRSRR